jgi:predicted nucleotidyltransferase
MVRKKIENKELEQLKTKIINILKEKCIKKAAIFGSYARGDQTDKNDIDILIEPPDDMGLEFFGLHIELEKKLGRTVDLLTYDEINRNFKDYILKDEVKII